MKKHIFSLAAACVLCVSAQGSHWGYGAENGPDTWGSVKEFETCKIGTKQSPIDVIEKGSKSVKNELKIDYSAHLQDALNNGHTLQIDAEHKNHLYFNKVQYDLHQFHFHTPSENHINGKEYPLEAHFVHKDSLGDILVMAVMFEEGEANSELADIIKHFPADKNKPVAYDGIEVKKLIPENHAYFSFEGSLTTPPCSEKVTWVVLKAPLSASKEQIKAFNDIMGNNDRGLQPLNGREIKSAN